MRGACWTGGGSGLLGGVLAAACLAVAPLPSLAQETAPVGILIVNQARIHLQAAAAQEITREEQARNAALRDAYDRIRSQLRDREREMIDLRATLPKEEFDALAAAFERDVRASRNGVEGNRRLIQGALAQAKEVLALALQNVLVEIMKERGALLILDEKTSIAHAAALDVTDEAIARLNLALPRIDIAPTPLQLPALE